MPTVRVSQTVPSTVAEAERCWYATAGWPRWIDGCDRVLRVDPQWPAVGATVVWGTGPAGRGEVTEHVVAHKPLEGQTLEVQDDSIFGRQQVAFVPVGLEAVTVELSLAYQLRRRSLFSPLVDLLFIRRAMDASLATTLRRFSAELDGTLRRSGSDLAP
jgi:hypothetical protein